MRSSLYFAVFALLLAGCALRPRYADFVTLNTQGKEAVFLLIDPATKLPIANAKIEVSENRSRINVTTAADGSFKLPVDKKYVDENPVFAVTLPKGYTEYVVQLAPPAPVPMAPPPVPNVPAAPVAPVETVDAGTPASNG
jgi:hypothetical protein